VIRWEMRRVPIICSCTPPPCILIRMVERSVKTSKFLCWVLRHRPDKLGLALDPHGWIGISELIDGARACGAALDRALIFEIVETDEKGRYQVSEDLKRIRARYGHSVPVQLDIDPTQPPATLYHGTARHYLGSILHLGLHPRRRRFVHLSSDPGAASMVGGRHGESVVLAIDAGRMHADGCELFRITEDLWLTRSVPATYIRLDEHR
jgi:putative RNA 2'-phosphotransferase